MLATASDTLGVANALASMQAGKRANAAKTPVFGWRLVARDPARWQAAAETLACSWEALPQDDVQLGDALIVPPLHFDHIGTLEQRLALLDAERSTIRRVICRPGGSWRRRSRGWRCWPTYCRPASA